MGSRTAVLWGRRHDSPSSGFSSWVVEILEEDENVDDFHVRVIIAEPGDGGVSVELLVPFNSPLDDIWPPGQMSLPLFLGRYRRSQ